MHNNEIDKMSEEEIGPLCTKYNENSNGAFLKMGQELHDNYLIKYHNSYNEESLEDTFCVAKLSLKMWRTQQACKLAVSVLKDCLAFLAGGTHDPETTIEEAIDALMEVIE